MLKPSNPILQAAQQGHEKRDVNPDRRGRLPQAVADALPQELAEVAVFLIPDLLNRFNLTNVREITAGREPILLYPGQVWKSLNTCCQYAFAARLRAQGKEWANEDLDLDLNAEYRQFYNRVYGQLRRAKGVIRGVARKVRLVGGGGVQGMVWEVLPSFIEAYEAGQCTVDPVEDPDPLFEDHEGHFKHAEMCLGVRDRGRSANAEAWVNAVATQSHATEALTSVGAFSVHDVRRLDKWKNPAYDWKVDADTPCFLPWIRLDIDGPDLVEAHERACEVLTTLHEWGVDTGELTAVYTRGRGFHVWIPAGILGNPAYLNAHAAVTALTRFTDHVFEDTFDPSVYDPRQLIRLPGGRRNGGFVTPFAGDEFLSLSLQEITQRSQTHTPYRFAPPREATKNEALSTVFRTLARQRFWAPRFEDVDPDAGYGAGGVIERALQGIEEGESWSEKHHGRNKAAFVLGCYFVKQYGAIQARRELSQWNQRNSPPLPERELESCHRSAVRTLNRTPRRGAEGRR